MTAQDADLVGFAAGAEALLDRIKPLLAGSDAELQGAVICDLAALWIAGHRMPDRAEGDRMRAELLQLHTAHVRELVQMYLKGVDG